MLCDTTATVTATFVGGHLNLPPGETTVTVTLPDGGPTLGTDTVMIRPGWLTTAWIEPDRLAKSEN